jgi:hypothetical protein
MKKLIYVLLIAILLVGMSCKKKVDIVKETEAIKALIHNETQAFLQNDTAKILSYYIKDDFQTRLSASCDTFILNKGWKELSTFFKKINMGGFSNSKNTKDFIQIKVVGDAAWAIYKDKWSYVTTVTTLGSTKDTLITVYLLCTMNLEKKVNEWKISSLSLYQPNK